MKTVLTYGTFDLLHYGHINFLKKAKSMGDVLIVGLCSDEFNSKKGKKSFYNFNIRKEMLSAIKYVDEIFMQDSFEQKADDIKKYNADILVSSEDWSGKYDYLKNMCEVIYLNRTPGISTSQIKNLMK